MSTKHRVLTKLANNVIWVAILLSGFYWIIDAVVRAQIFNVGEINQQLLSPTSQEIWFRTMVAFILIISSAFAQSIINKRRRMEAIVKETGRQYKTLFDAANDAIFIMDKDKFIECNERTLQLFGCTREQILGQPPYLFSPETQPDGKSSKIKALDKINTALKGEPQLFEWKHCRYDRTPFDAEVSLNRIDISNRIYLQAIVRDISERKKAEDEIANIQALLLAAIEESPAGILIADAPDAKIRFANTAALGIHGQSDRRLTDIPDEMDPVNWQIFHPNGTPFEAEELPLSQAIVYGKTCRNMEAIIQRPDGEKQWVLINAAPVKDSKGGIIAGVVVLPDITNRKAAEDTLQEREELLRATLEATADGILVANDKGEITHINARFAEMWQIPDELSGPDYGDKFLKYVVNQLADPDKSIAEAGELHKSSQKKLDTIYFKDGRIFESYTCPLIHRGKTAGRVWSFRDISKWKDVEAHKQLINQQR